MHPVRAIPATLLLFLFLSAPACDDSATDSATDDVGAPGTDPDSSPPTDAHFIADMVRMARADGACDLDGDGKNDNAVMAMLNAIPPQFVTKTPNQTLADGLADGTLLMVVGVHDIEDFASDDDVALKLYGGQREDPVAGLPDDIYSGEGGIGAIEPEYSLVSGSFADGTLTVTSIEKVGITVPVGDSFVLAEIDQPRAFATISPVPDAAMLHGKVPQGKICGAIKAKTLVDLATASPKVADGLRPLLAGIINEPC